MILNFETKRDTEQVKTGMFNKETNNLYTTVLSIEITKEEREVIESHPLMRNLIFLTYKTSLSPQSVNKNLSSQEKHITYHSILINNKFTFKTYSFTETTELRSEILNIVDRFNSAISIAVDIEKPLHIDTDSFKEEE